MTAIPSNNNKNIHHFIYGSVPEQEDQKRTKHYQEPRHFKKH